MILGGFCTYNILTQDHYVANKMKFNLIINTTKREYFILFHIYSQFNDLKININHVNKKLTPHPWNPQTIRIISRSNH